MLLSTMTLLFASNAEACSGPVLTTTVSTVEDTMISQGDPTGLWKAFWVNLGSIETGTLGFGDTWSLYELDGVQFFPALTQLAGGACLVSATFEVELVDYGSTGTADTALWATDVFDPFNVYWNVAPSLLVQSDVVTPPLALGTVPFDASAIVDQAVRKYTGAVVPGPYLALTPDNPGGYNWWQDLSGELHVVYQLP
ncbi:MAG: hypothetical protein AAF602_16730 [Myxococcota bacterium]